MFLQYPLTTKNGDLVLVPEGVDETLYRVWYLIDSQRDALLFADQGVILTYIQGLLDTLTPKGVNPYQIQAIMQNSKLQITIAQNNTNVLNLVI